MILQKPISEFDPNLLLEVRNLTVQFEHETGMTNAVKNISFTLKKGEVLGIVGESGSGKSVTSLSILQLLNIPPGRISSGEIWFNSPSKGWIDLLTLSVKEIRNIRGKEIGMIFQEPMTSLNPVFTCGNQVAEVLMLHEGLNSKKAKEKALELFSKVKLPKPERIFNCYPHELSGGQKQRVMIAMSISCNPAMLIADEPTTALDVTVQATILELLESIRKEFGTSILFITHDLGVIAEISHHVMVMYRGDVVEKGSLLDVMVNPKHPYTKGLLACRPKLDFKLKSLPVVSDFMVTDDFGQVTEKSDGEFGSVGEAIFMNLITEEEVTKRNKQLIQQEPLLSVKNLKTYFPIGKGLFRKATDFIKAVDNVSFDIYPGETIGLVGESGCGKTTLGRTLIKLLDPTEGQILYKGRNISSFNSHEMRVLRREMQIIFQDPYSSLNPRITIGDAIVEPMRIHGVLSSDKERKERVVELLETVNLNGHHLNRYPHEFSGGQRQRICIARALALNPSFLICDESVSALDVSVQAQVLNLINNLKEKFHFTCVFISHDLSVVKFMADRLIVMNHGIIEEMGFAEDIYKNPQSFYTQTLIDAIPKGTVEDIRRVQKKRALQAH
ncbi:MAG TPA: ABC transporter ATP-binding protein [Cytophagales bacterium]|nr:ABC transporter ATP-binding protein [Cytophagales bacterium]